MRRLVPIEGLRGYLAICVLLNHVLLSTGYSDNYGRLISFFTDGAVAVKCFVIISGFVIFLLLDTKKEPYKLFITRRFFRIYPVYFILFLLSIPCNLLFQSIFLQTQAKGWFSPGWAAFVSRDFTTLWANAWLHIPVHLLLFQGLIPNKILPGSSSAFLAPAWSLSLEWQFYLVAPLFFYLLTAREKWKGFSICAFCFVVMVFSRRFLPTIDMNAALPFFLGYFFVGWLSYFLYRWFADSQIGKDRIFPAVLIISAVSVVILKVSAQNSSLMPLLIWACVFALILEPATSFSSRFVAPLFSNPVSAWLGKISYSVYLSHGLVIVVMKWFLLALLPTVTKFQHVTLLLPLTLGGTVLLSAALYHVIEAPFIKLGSRLTHVPSSIEN